MDGFLVRLSPRARVITHARARTRSGPSRDCRMLLMTRSQPSFPRTNACSVYESAPRPLKDAPGCLGTGIAMKTYYIPCDCFSPKMIVASAVTGYTCFGCPMGSLPFLVNSSKPYHVDANATFNFFEVRADKDFVCLGTDYTNRTFTPTTECDGWEVCPVISKPCCVLSYAISNLPPLPLVVSLSLTVSAVCSAPPSAWALDKRCCRWFLSGVQ